MNTLPINYTVHGYKLSIVNIDSDNVYIGSFIHNGGMHESTKLCGINHLLEHVLTDAWTKCNDESCFTYWNKYPVSLNAATSTTFVKYYINGLRKYLPSMLEYMVDIIINPVITEKNIHHEKEIILNELKGYIDSPNNLLLHKMNQVLYNKQGIINSSDYRLHIDNLRHITPTVIMNYYKRKYLPNNIVFYVVGKFDEPNILQIKNMFQSLVRKKTPTNKTEKPVYFTNVFTNVSRIVYHKNSSAENTSFFITIPIILSYSQLNALDILSSIMQTRLFDLLRIQKKLVYDVFVDSDNYYYGSELSIYGSCLDSNIKMVLTEILLWLQNFTILQILQD